MAEKPTNPPLPSPLGPQEGEKKQETLTEAAIRQAIEGYGKQTEEFRKVLEDLAKAASLKQQDILDALGLDVGKTGVIAEAMTQLQEVTRLAKEGKLGEYSDETPIPELMQRMRHLKEAQKKALETGEVDLAAANEWLINRWPEHRPCPLCNHEEWGFGPSFVQLPTSTLGLRSPPRTNPCVAVVCGHCGNTMLLNAIIMGLIPSPKSED
jgi:predicted RNase H-like HicB family nuclease